MTQRSATFLCLVCHEPGMGIQSLKLVGPCGHLFCAGCIARFNATRDQHNLSRQCPFCRDNRTFPVPRAVRAEPVAPQAEHDALVARIEKLQTEIHDYRFLINRAQDETRAETEEKRALIRDWDHLCQRASGSTSQDTSSSGVGR
ncbi:hypothetical protein FRC12_013586 [Ceratobasidium sp. 428]|nr:hypothetical protein FRC09_011292 [Ceratobasidium sp. 395]KAG8789392.1 hypothetical protein FRC12_013586 [Ceratobasidium sp. 428]